MKTSWKPQFCMKQLHKRFPKITSKPWISITNNSTWKTMLCYNFIKVLLCCMASLRIIQWYKYRKLAKHINYSHNAIKIFNLGQISNKINMYYFPWLIRNRNILLKTIFFIGISLLPCTFFTPSAETHYVLWYFFPGKMFTQHFCRTFGAKMSTVIMIFSY